MVKPLSKILISKFVIWYLTILVITFLGFRLFPHYSANLDISYIERWANWDGGHFRSIAENGYIAPQSPFFPVYPLFIKLGMILGLNSLFSGLVVSIFSSFICLYIFQKLVLFDFKQNIADTAVLLLLAFPTSFILVSLYSDSLFFAFSLASFYFARKKAWLYSFFLAGLSAATRQVGIALIIAVFIEYFLKNPSITFNQFFSKKLKKLLLPLYIYLISQGFSILAYSKQMYQLVSFINAFSYLVMLFSFFYWAKITITSILEKKVKVNAIDKNSGMYLLLSIFPLILYLTYLYLIRGNPLIFITDQLNWGRKPVFFAETILNQALIFANFTDFFTNQQSFISALNIFFIVFSFAALFYSVKVLRFSYTIYFLISLLIPLSTGTFTGIQRYLLTIFPLILTISLIQKKWVILTWGLFSQLILVVLSVMFINGFPID